MENEIKEPAFKYNYISPAEYLAMERASEEKHEYYDGQVYAMAGASMNHVRINRNITFRITGYLSGKDCEILPTDMRVGSPVQDAYMYPDSSIVCGKKELADDTFETLLNPSVIFEILSPSTRSIDKGRKLFFYQGIPSLQEFIMIDSLKRYAQIARKQADGLWAFENLNDTTVSLFIRTIDFHLAFDDIYTDTGF